MRLLTEITNDPTYAQLEVGESVADGLATVVKCEQLSNRVPNDTYASWVALCVRKHDLHPYVVWTIIARPNGFIAEQGDYCRTFEEGLSAYSKRAS